MTVMRGRPPVGAPEHRIAPLAGEGVDDGVRGRVDDPAAVPCLFDFEHDDLGFACGCGEAGVVCG